LSLAVPPKRFEVASGLGPRAVIEVTWTELLAHPAVNTTVTLGSDVAMLAYHGGVEAGTHEVALAAAERSGASLYAVQQPYELGWHVPSALVDPSADPGLAAVLDRARLALSVHGYWRRTRPWEILLGGSNRALAAKLAARLRAGQESRPVLFDAVVIDDLAEIPAALRGLHPDNPVNLPAEGGVQIELSRRVRRSPDHLAWVAQSLAEVAAEAAA
jgi:phage replication-related protein YjqB (UPF0714/DUF867 family)